MPPGTLGDPASLVAKARTGTKEIEQSDWSMGPEVRWSRPLVAWVGVCVCVCVVCVCAGEARVCVVVLGRPHQ